MSTDELQKSLDEILRELEEASAQAGTVAVTLGELDDAYTALEKDAEALDESLSSVGREQAKELEDAANEFKQELDKEE